jgi:hypothetical protein
MQDGRTRRRQQNPVRPRNRHHLVRRHRGSDRPQGDGSRAARLAGSRQHGARQGRLLRVELVVLAEPLVDETAQLIERGQETTSMRVPLKGRRWFSQRHQARKGT